jgi:two-component system chemotaxis response regulator CheB
MSVAGHTGGDAAGVVVMAASDGGLAAYQELLASLPASFPWPILLVQHRHPDADFLAPLLARATELRVAPARARVRPDGGTVYVLPPDRQTLLDERGRFRFAAARRGRADPLLESAARAHGDRVVAVVLTGRLDDGVAGVRAIKRRGGRVIVQDQPTSKAYGMPRAAVATGCADFVLPLPSIAPALVSLVMVPGAAELFRVRLNPWAAAGG